MLINCEVKNCVVKMRRDLREIQKREEQKQEREGEVRGSESHDGNSDLLGERAFSRLEGRRRNL